MNKLRDGYMEWMRTSGAYVSQVQDAVRLVLRDAKIEHVAAADLVGALNSAAQNAYVEAFAKHLSEDPDLDAAGDAAMLAAEEAAEKGLKDYRAETQKETPAI